MQYFYLQFQLITFAVVSAITISDKEYAAMPELNSVDDYDRCLMYGENFYYCALRIQLFPTTPENPSKVWKTIEEVISDERNYRHDILRWMVCVPEILRNVSSSIYHDEIEIRQKLEEYYKRSFKHFGLGANITVMSCDSPKQEDRDPLIETYKLVFTPIVVIYALFLIYATIYDIVITSKSNEKHENYTESFMVKFTYAMSLRKNWQRLMSVNLFTPDMKALRCIQGYRFYGMAVVIILHEGYLSMIYPMSNTKFAEDIWRKPLFLVYDGSYPMQTFFMLSGFLTSYQVLSEAESGMKMKMPTKMRMPHFMKTFANRYVRLTPLLAFSIFFNLTWLKYVSNGPFWNGFTKRIYQECKTNWWTNLLYIHTIINGEPMCAHTTWFLAVSVQLYILSFLLMCVIAKYPKRVVQIFVTVVLAHVLCLFTIIYRNGYNHMVPRIEVLEEIPVANLGANPEFRLLHLSLYTNSAGVIAGLIMGYIFFKYRGKNLFTTKFRILLWWIFSLGIPLTIMVIDTHVHFESQFYLALHASLKKIIFAFGNGIMLFGMTQGQGWILRWLCDTNGVYILGKLSYGAYIFHPTLQMAYSASRRNLNIVSIANLLFDALGVVSLSLVVASFTTLFIEMPIMELYRCLTSPHRRDKSVNVILRNENKCS